jgi:putative acetyltransferase
VLPTYQRRGVGQALMHAVLGAADALAFPVGALLGNVDYYARFGFVAARSIGVIPPDPAWDDQFQARPLHTWNPALGGIFKYAAPFEDLDTGGHRAGDPGRGRTCYPARYPGTRGGRVGA